MKKGEIKEFFKVIRAFDLEKVKSLVESNNEYLTVCNFAPPQKDDGQSCLQIAFKIGAFDIAEYLINKGADVNFIEQSEINAWRAPVLHDCIRAVFYQTNTVQKDSKNFSVAFRLLKLILDKGADPNAVDSYGNSSLIRAFMDAKTFIKHPAFKKELKTVDESRMVFCELIQHGANAEYSNDKRESLKAHIARDEFEKYELLNFEKLPRFETIQEKKGLWKRIFEK